MSDVSQLRYTEAEVEQIRALFPDLDTLKLYRKYLMDLPLTHDEVDRVQALWASASVRAIIRKVTLPELDGNEAIGVGYDLMHNLSHTSENFDYLSRRAAHFAAAARYLDERIDGLDTLPESATGTRLWLTSYVLKGAMKVDHGPYDNDENATALMEQIIIKQNVEGILVGLNAIINMPVETDEQKAARLAADSTN